MGALKGIPSRNEYRDILTRPMSRGKPGSPKSPEHKAKLQAAARKRYSSEQERLAQAERMRTVFQTNDAARRMHSQESRDKQGATMKQLWADPTYRTPMTALRSSSEHKETLRQAMTAWWSNPESRQVRCAQISSARRRHLSQDHQQLLENPQWLADQNNTHTLTEIADYLGCAQSLISAQFKKFGLIPKQHGVSYTGGGTTDHSLC